MIGRQLVFLGVLLFVGLLGFLTLRVALDEGVDFLVIISFVVLALLGFGALGALLAPPDD
jgi:hypothetical protein